MTEMVNQARQHLRNSALMLRIFALLGMVGILVALRHLAVFFVAFFVFQRALGWVGSRLAIRKNHPLGILLALVLLVLALGVGLVALVKLGAPKFCNFVPESQGIEYYIQKIQGALAQKIPCPKLIDLLLTWIKTHLKKDDIDVFLKEHSPAYAKLMGRVLVQLLAGLIVAVIYQLDRVRVDAWMTPKREESFFGHLKKYFRFLGDAAVITVQLQVVVALVNTLLTLPLLVLFRLPHLGILLTIIFLSSLVPILGNFVSGTVLAVVSFLHQGILGVVLFLGVTFVLHKIETYYLNPRLGARHVQLPMLVLVVSLIVFEHMFGFAGVFLSFPFLYVVIKVIQDVRQVIESKSETIIQPASS